MKKPTHKLFKDLTGQVFGMYTVLEYAGEAWPEKKRNRGHQWKCKCGCGEERVVIGSCLKSGKSTGCGCTRNKHRLIDLKGKKFGKLTVLSYSKVIKKQPLWLCECECGAQKEIMGANLREGKSKSCGCMSGGVIHGLSGKKGYKKYLLSDPVKKIKHNVSGAVKRALKLKNATKGGGKTFKSLPYTAQELKDHLESQFEDWMNWGNYGGRMSNPKKTWHMDHIIPQCSFDYTSLDDELFQECWALSNLRPLEKIANVKKGSKL